MLEVHIGPLMVPTYAGAAGLELAGDEIDVLVATALDVDHDGIVTDVAAALAELDQLLDGT